MTYLLQIPRPIDTTEEHAAATVAPYGTHRPVPGARRAQDNRRCRLPHLRPLGEEERRTK